MISRKFLLVCMLSFNGVFASYYPTLKLDCSPATVAGYVSPVVPSPTRSCLSPLMRKTTPESLPEAGISKQLATQLRVHGYLRITRKGTVREFEEVVVGGFDRTGVFAAARRGCPIAQKAVLTVAQELENQQARSSEENPDALNKQRLLKTACNININKHEKCFRVIPVRDI